MCSPASGFVVRSIIAQKGIPIMCLTNYQYWKQNQSEASDQLKDRIRKWYDGNYSQEEEELREKFQQLSYDFRDEAQTKEEIKLADVAGETSLERLTKGLTIPEIAAIAVLRKEVKSLITRDPVLKSIVSAAADRPSSASKLFAAAIRSLAAEAAVAWEKTYPRLAQRENDILYPPAPEPEPVKEPVAETTEPKPDPVAETTPESTETSPVAVDNA